MSVLGLVIALAAADAASGPQEVVEARFAPLSRRERTYQSLGPVGPYYPHSAVQAGSNGEAVIQCKAAAEGRLKSCKVVSEEPRRHGFGVAAQIMAGRGHVRIAEDAVAPGSTVRVRVPFVIGAAAEVEP